MKNFLLTLNVLISSSILLFTTLGTSYAPNVSAGDVPIELNQCMSVNDSMKLENLFLAQSHDLALLKLLNKTKNIHYWLLLKVHKNRNIRFLWAYQFPQSNKGLSGLAVINRIPALKALYWEDRSPISPSTTHPGDEYSYLFSGAIDEFKLELLFEGTRWLNHSSELETELSPGSTQIPTGMHQNTGADRAVTVAGSERTKPETQRQEFHVKEALLTQDSNRFLIIAVDAKNRTRLFISEAVSPQYKQFDMSRGSFVFNLPNDQTAIPLKEASGFRQAPSLAMSQSSYEFNIESKNYTLISTAMSQWTLRTGKSQGSFTGTPSRDLPLLTVPRNQLSQLPLVYPTDCDADLK